MEVGLGFSGRDDPDGLEQAAVAEPVHPFEGCIFHGLEAAPRSATVDDFRLEETFDCHGQWVVMAVADAASRSVHIIGRYWLPWLPW